MAFDTSIDAEAIINATPDQLKSWYWRVCHLYTIADQNGKVVPFRPNMAQRRFMKDIDGHGPAHHPESPPARLHHAYSDHNSR